MGNQSCVHAPQELSLEGDLQTWTPDHVFAWLSTVDNCELKATANVFKKNRINGNELLALHHEKSEQRLITMNIPLGDRILLHQALDRLLKHKKQQQLQQQQRSQSNLSSLQRSSTRTLPTAGSTRIVSNTAQFPITATRNVTPRNLAPSRFDAGQHQPAAVHVAQLQPPSLNATVNSKKRPLIMAEIEIPCDAHPLLDENHSSQHTHHSHSEREESSPFAKKPSLHDRHSNSDRLPKHSNNSNKSERSQPHSLRLTIHHSDQNSNNISSKTHTAARKTPSLSPLRQSLSKIKDFKHVFQHSGGDVGDFVMLDTPTGSSRESSCEPPPKPVLNALDPSRKRPGFQNNEWQTREEYKHVDAAQPVGPHPLLGPLHRPALAEYRSHTSLKRRSIAQSNQVQSGNVNDANYFNWRADAGDVTNYCVPDDRVPTMHMSMIQSYKIPQKAKTDNEDSNDQEATGSTMMFYEDSESYPSAIKHLTSKHTRSLFMLEITKRYLLIGYLREYDIEIKIAGIEQLITAYFDDSLIMYEIKIADLFQQIAANNTRKLCGKTFTFDLNLDHEIELVPTLKVQQTRDGNDELVNDIELSLECENLPSKIDKCDVLINMLCICHEIKYQKIDIYSFGLDYYNKSGDYHNFNLLNKRGLQMIVPQTDIENLNELEFKINATVLHIEYDPNYENFGVIPAYNERLTMSQNVHYEWKLNERILKIMKMDIFKQKFYSPHFDQEHWVVSCYKNKGHIMVCLNLLRLPARLQSIECKAIIAIQKQKQILCRMEENISMDIQYNNCFKWTLDEEAAHTLFNAVCSEHAVSINVDIEVTDSALKQSKPANDSVYDEYFPDDEEEHDDDDQDFEYVAEE